MSAVGSLVIAAIGFNFLGARDTEIKVANLIPAIFIPLIAMTFQDFFLGCCFVVFV
jgi:uncharacterized membrane protein YqgA involved in biofilm formation